MLFYMKPIQSSRNCHKSRQGGFTLVELLVSLGLFSLIGALVARVIVLQSDTYMTDISRVRIQQNLRGALDVMAMNVRQAGENLNSFFPAVVMTSAPSIALRRNLVQQVLSACQNIVGPQIFIDNPAATTPACLPVDIAPSLAAWESYRVAQGGTVPIYIYDIVSKTGEFVNYTGTGSNSTGDFLYISAPVNQYPQASTNMYVLEEYLFSINAATNTVELTIDQAANSQEDVAYDVTQLQMQITMQDGTVVTSLSPSSTYNWGNIQNVYIAMTGQDTWKSHTVTRTVDGQYFPRNVLSQ